jgi:murein DD-endopeptidase MepM/ murein hydrolase activator NlpD
MLFSKAIVTSFLSIGFTLVSMVSVAQQLVNEPAGGMDENELEETEILLPPSTTATPGNINLPLLNKYYNSWDTLYVRRYAEVPPKTGDSIILPLFNEHSEGYVFPVEGEFLSPFGYRGKRVHSGVDIRLEAGDPVMAAFDGVVRMARWYSGYGNCIVVRHFNGIETLYGHLSKIKVKVNQLVMAGDVIGLGGRTGRASCNHLHFETRFQGKAFNPKQLIDFSSYELLADTFAVTRSTFGLSRDYMPGISKSEPVADIITKSEASKSKKEKASKGKKKYHTIKKGDTLYALSRKYDVPVKQICRLNGMKESKKLQLGSKIRVK